MLDSNRKRLHNLAMRQWLTEERRSATVTDLVHHLVGIQAQVYNSPLFAAFARLQEVKTDDIRRELEDTRRLVRTWTVRGTMHVVDTNDLPLIWSALRPEREKRSRYLDKHIPREQREAVAEATLAVLSRGPATRAEIIVGVQEHLGCRDEWLMNLFSGWGGILKELAYEGKVLHGPVRGNDVLFVRTEDWVKVRPLDTDPDNALGELLVRYLEAYGPATLSDFAYWSGVTVQRAKNALKKAEDRVQVNGSFIDIPDQTLDGTPVKLRLLPRFDQYLLAHKQKFFLADKHYKQVFKIAAQVAAVIVAEGRVVGTWRLEGKASERRVVPQLFDNISKPLNKRLDAEMEYLNEFVRSGEKSKAKNG